MDRIGSRPMQQALYASTFEALARAIAYQQLSGKAAGTIYGRFLARYGDGVTPDARRVARAQMRGLRSVGLSRGKSDYIRGLARSQVEGELPGRGELDQMDDDNIIGALTSQKGVGEWTVQMLLMSWLGRPDVLAPNDLGLQKGMAIVDGIDSLPTPAQLTERGEVWRPWRSVASWYLWRATEL
ncbi:MAG: DNA-3-methyladenine glycosylase 2 family protein [Pseudomonadota bacterium]